MRWYAEAGPVRWRQQALDLAVLVWCWVFVRLGPGGARERRCGCRSRAGGCSRPAATSAASLGRAAERAGGVPLAGDALREPLDAAARASRAVADAGAAGQDAVAALALVLALVVALLPVGYVLGPLAARTGSATRGRRRRPVRLRGDVELLALRAAATLPLHRLRPLGDEPVRRWRRGEPGAAQALAALHAAARLGRRGAGTRPVPSRRRPAGRATARRPAAGPAKPSRRASAAASTPRQAIAFSISPPSTRRTASSSGTQDEVISASSCSCTSRSTSRTSRAR